MVPNVSIFHKARDHGEVSLHRKNRDTTYEVRHFIGRKDSGTATQRLGLHPTSLRSCNGAALNSGAPPHIASGNRDINDLFQYNDLF